jgi:hypothetical protein
MQKIIIFGGPDRCGKTTIAKTLSRVLGIPYFKPTNQQWFAMNDPSVFRKQTEFGEPKLLDFIKQTGQSVIMDRGFPCDYAYSKALVRETAWSTIEALDEEYGKLGAQLVFTLRTDYDGISDDWSKMSAKTLRALDHEYRMYAATSHMRHTLIISPPINPGVKDKPYPLKQQIADIIEMF